MTAYLHKRDLPAEVIADVFSDGPVAVDCEAMGLHQLRDRLCVIQLSGGGGDEHLVQFDAGEFDAPNLKVLLADPSRLKILHFARFDIALVQQYLAVVMAPVYCTKIASKLVRTYTDRHGLKDLTKEVLGRDISKDQQSSDWGAPELTDAQLAYAASDVLHLHALKERLDAMLAREGRTEIAQSCFDFLPTRAALDLAGWEDTDIFAHA